MAKPLKKKPVLTIEQKRIRLGTHLAKLREDAQETLKSMEEKTGIPGANIYRIEQGQAIKLEDAVALSDFFDCPLEDFVRILA